ncbi:MAG: ADOP family duplicated permease [Bryobacteraceae bacterium]
MLTSIWRSLKSWNRQKGLALLAAAALAIGIGSTVAIFTVVDGVLLKPLPYAQGKRWVALLGGSTLDPNHYSGLSPVECEAYRQEMRSFAVFGCYAVGGDFNITSPGEPRHIQGIEIAPSLIANTGALPIAGRFFTASDGPNVALISDRLFERLGAGIIGHPITLDGQPYLVVGAMPAWFRMPVTTVADQNSNNDVWIPLKKPKDANQARDYAYYASYGKLKAGIPFAQGKAEAIRVAEEIRKQIHPNDPTYTAAFFGLQESIVRTIRPILLLLFGAAALLLMITCANVAGLLISRSVGRARETALRIALGGGRNQLAAQYFLESLWISLAAVAGGIVLSVVLVRILLALAADYIPRSYDVSSNWPALGFAMALAFLTAALSAVAPLVQAFRTPPAEALTNGVRASAGARSRRLSQVLVIGEVALAFTLISSGALLMWQFRSLNRTPPGLNPKDVLVFQLTRGGAGASDEKQTSAYTQRVLDALDSIPGVRSAAVANQLPMEGCCFTTSFVPKGRYTGKELYEPVSLMVVSGDYFKTMGIPLIGGRLLNAHDTSETLLPILIGQDGADRYWPRENAVGKLAQIGGRDGSKVQIVGVVGTIHNEGLGQRPTPCIYLIDKVYPLASMYVAVRSTLPETSLSPAIRRAIARVDPAQPIYGMRPMEDVVETSLIFERIEWIVVTFFAMAALLMACLGIYGLMSYSVRQRITEMGTRLAIGSTNGQLLGLIVRDGLRLSMYGILGGAIMTAGATQIVTHYFKVQHLSPIPYLLSTVLVFAVGALASLAPAWRASLLSPMVAIRNDSESVWTSIRRSFELARGHMLPSKDAPAVDSTLLTEFIESSRRADSFAEMLEAFIQSLRTKIHAKSAFLLEKAPVGEFRCMAALPNGSAATPMIPENGFLLNRLRFYGSPMGFSERDLETCRRWAVDERPGLVSELESLEAIHLGLAAPLRTKKELIGLLLFGEHESHDEYSTPEKNLVAACTEQFALTMENARLNDRVVEQEKVNRDIALATEVQKRLLPEGSPTSSSSTFGAFSLAARSVGGDYYDFLRLGDKEIGIALADVAGKGIAAALIMAVVQASLRIIAADERVTLPELAAKMNRFLHRSTGFNSYATFFYAQLDEDKRQLRYVNAGHNPPYLVRALTSQEKANGSGGAIEELATGGMIIGMFPAARYEEATVDLNSGDVLLAFTDGVTEALNPAQEEFGEERLKALVRRVAHLPATEMTPLIAQELRDWIADAPQHDDLTFLVMKVN